jgi:hypothetical protein
MKSPIATLALFGILAANAAWSQTQTQTPVSGTAQPNSPRPAPNQAGNVSAPGDKPLIPRGAEAPPLTPVNDLKPPTTPLPDEPIEPYLLTKDNGPFMVHCRDFVGPDAERMALALVKELRNEFGLPAYILRLKDYPGRSNIRGVPPTVPSQVKAPNIKYPEKIRTQDLAAVLVGNETTLAGQEKLWRHVKKLNPKCLEGMSSPYWWRKGLSQALRTTNPYVPAQLLYPQPKDKMVVLWNSGQRSIANCPGAYSLQIADFSGRSTFQFGSNDMPQQLLPDLRSSPLRTAHDDAERMAEKLSKAPEIQKLGQPIYVYHDRTTSKVFIGSFNSPQDPAAAAMREELVKNAVVLANKNKRGKGAVDTMIVPAIALSEVKDMKAKIRN